MKTFRAVCLLFVLLLALITPSSRHELRIANRTLLPQAQPVATVRAGLSHPTPKARARISETYGKLPLSFEANQGQTDKEVKFLSRGSGYQLYLTATEAVLQFRNGKTDGATGRRVEGANHDATGSSGTRPPAAALKMKLVGANPASPVTGHEELPGKSNYFIGNDPTKWHTNVPNYAKVEYEQVWPGVNLVYYGKQRQLEYDFVVAPGADPRAIRLSFDGAEKLEIDAQGNLALRIAGGEVVMQKPLVYQEVDGARKEIAGGYILEGKQARFRLGEYDANKPLVIDPVLSYSTYLGGNSFDGGNGIAVDSSGNAYLTGQTASSNFPTANPLQATYGGGISDAFVAKLNPSGSALVYSTYLGGNTEDAGFGIAVDSSGNAYVIGRTYSPNFPTANPLQAVLNRDPNPSFAPDAFVAKLNPAGSALVYSTYLGGSRDELGQSIAVDSSGNAYVIGDTDSSNFPTANPLQAVLNRDPNLITSRDAFVAKLNPAGSALVYSTYLGGGTSESGTGIAVDSTGNAYVTGGTTSTNFPTANPLQATLRGTGDAYVAKLNPTGSALVYSTYLGGDMGDGANGVAVDSSGNAYVTGGTTSTNFPTANPLQATFGGGFLGDAFVVKLNPAGSALVYSTYLGGSMTDTGVDIAVDSAGDASVIGTTSSPNFPTANPLQATLAGGQDAFVTKLNPVGSALIYSTYLGGNMNTAGADIAVDATGNAYVTGQTSSTNFPTKNPVQPTLGGGADGFVTKISDDTTPIPTAPAPACKPDRPQPGSLQSPVPHGPRVPQSSSKADQARLNNIYGQLPLSFEANRGQTNPEVRFISHGDGYGLFLAPTEAVLTLRKDAGEKGKADGKATDSAFTTLRMKFAGANPSPEMKGLGELPARSNYLIGSEPKLWHTDIPVYSKVEYQDIYPGVDLVYYGKQRQLEYDLIVAPGANPKSIKLAFEGAEKIEIDGQGNLVLHTPDGELRQHKPVTYQEVAGVRKQISSRYVRKGKDQVGFQVGNYDRLQPLIIDPVLTFSTFLGGNDRDEGFGIAVDAAGNTYVTGRTISATGFPTQSAFQSAKQPGFDVFVTKFDPTKAGAESLVYSTFLGGNDHDEGFGIAVDAAGNAYVTGRTFSGDQILGFPVIKNAAFQAELKGGSDAFMTKLNAAGNGLLYSTFLGSLANDDGFGIAVDLAGNAYVTGRTATGLPSVPSDFPVKNAFQPFSQGGLDVFVTKFDPTKSKVDSLVYSTFLGGVESDEGVAIAVDAAGNAYVTGRTLSGGPVGKFPINNAIQRDGQSGFDAFVSKLGPAGSALLYSTFLGGSDTDEGCSIAVDADSNAYVTGRTDSGNFPTRNALQSTRQGSFDAFVTKLQTSPPTCTQGDIGGITIFCRESLVYSTFLGGGGDDLACGIALDTLNNAYITGRTLSNNFPILHAIQPLRRADFDVFVTKFVAAGSALHYSTFLGGGDSDEGFGIAVAIEDSAFVTGRTRSVDFPTNSAFQSTNRGGFDAFIAKLTSGLQIPKTLNFGGVGLGDTKDLPLVIRNIDIQRIVVDSLTSSAAPEFSVIMPAGGFPIESGTSQIVTVRFTPLAEGVRRATLRIISDDPGRPIFDVVLLGGGVDPGTPKIEVAPTSLDFGDVPLGQPKDLILTVRNTGVVSPLTISELGIETSRFSVVLPGTPVTLAAGAATTVILRFSPSFLGRVDGGLIIASNAVNQPNLFVPLIGVGVTPGNTTIQVTPTGLDFGNVTTGESRDLTLTVRNTGAALLVVNPIASSNPRFSVTAPAMPFIVATGAQQTLTVRFAPAAAGPQPGALTLTSNAANFPTVAITLTGAGVGAPDIVATPGTLDFGSAAPGQSVTRTLTISNPGDAALSIYAITSSNPSFSIALPVTPLSVPAGGLTLLTASFTPTSVGAQNGTLLIASSAVNKNTFAVQARGETPGEILATDDGTVEMGALQDGLLIVNRLTPPRYPVTLRSLRIFFAQFQGLPSPVGEQIRLVAFADPSGSGQPPLNPTLLVNQMVTIPAIPADGGFVDFPISVAAAATAETEAALRSLAIESGDIYVGFQAPRPARGVVFAADANGPQQQRAFFSTNDGGSYSKLTGLQNPGGSLTSANIRELSGLQITPVNIMTQAGIGGVGVCSYSLSPSNQVFTESGGSGTVTITAATGCNWTALSTANWITFNANSSGTGNGTVGFSVAAGTVSRQAAVTIAGKPFTIAQAEKVASVSSASFQRQGLAGEAIAAAFGVSLALATQGAATIPLPTALAGTTVKVRDAAGTELFAPLFFVSPNQVNFLMPPGLIPGTATVTVTNSDGASAVGAVLNDIVAPGLFTANSDAQGAPAAQALRVKVDGSQIYEPVARFDAQLARFVTLPIDLGPPGEQVFLVLFGTGVRGRSSLAAATVLIGGVEAPALFAGATGSFVGLDQVNTTLPRSLIGHGEVDVVLRVDGKAANTVRINIK